jgi:type II secretory pathway pseudopilin PulG
MIEVILAIAIIAIGLFAVMSLATIVIKGNAYSKKVTTATTLAQDKLEYFKGIDYDNVLGTSTVPQGYPDYYLQALVQNNIPGTNTKTVTVTVYWSPGTPTSSHKVTLQTIFAK